MQKILKLQVVHYRIDENILDVEKTLKISLNFLAPFKYYSREHF